MFTLDEKFDSVAKMKVIGVGGAGGNAVNRMISEGLSGVEFISVNTDAMALDNNKAGKRIQIGERITKGLGAGANPDIGRIAMEEDRDKIAELVEGADVVFITAGMGGGTGTGGAPVIAEITKELDILAIAIVTRPFIFEGKIRDKNAKKGIEDLKRKVDTIITIQNQKLLSIVDRSTSLMDAFKSADEVLHNATKGISDLISVHGLVNLDFADVKTIMKGMGDALMGSGIAEGENRATNAADAAIHSPMLDDISIAGAKGILINVTGGEDLTLYDVGDATQTIYDAVGEDNDANIIFGAVTDPTMTDKIQVTVIATGFNDEKAEISSSRHSIQSLSTNFKKKQFLNEDLKENEVEQMAIDLDEVKVEEQKPKIKITEHETINHETINKVNSETRAVKKMEVISRNSKISASRESREQDRTKEESKQNKDGYSQKYGMPMVVKKGNMKKEQIFVSKGQVISHYEDDMDIPTFLRKQMQ